MLQWSFCFFNFNVVFTNSNSFIKLSQLANNSYLFTKLETVITDVLLIISNFIARTSIVLKLRFHLSVAYLVVSIFSQPIPH